MFDENAFCQDFYKYIKERFGNFEGNYDDLYDIYSFDYISSLIETNSHDENKYIAELLGTCDVSKTDISDEDYKMYADYAYGKLWNRVVKDFSLCEVSDADTDNEIE